MISSGPLVSDPGWACDTALGTWSWDSDAPEQSFSVLSLFAPRPEILKDSDSVLFICTPHLARDQQEQAVGGICRRPSGPGLALARIYMVTLPFNKSSLGTQQGLE